MFEELAGQFKKRTNVLPMPNTGTVLDISAGHYLPGHKGQTILNGGFTRWQCIAALPNMFKTTGSAGLMAPTLMAFPSSVFHSHDTETTQNDTRMENLLLNNMRLYKDLGVQVPESLVAARRLMFTSQVDYNGTEVFNLLRSLGKKRQESGARIKYEILDKNTNKPLEWFAPILSFWDSLSGMQCESAELMMDEGSVGTSDLNMLAMRGNMAKAQIVDQLPSFTARSGIFVLATGHVGQQYQLDPRKPNVRTLRFMRDNLKLKKIPENLSFSTINCYVITRFQPLLTNGSPEFPWSPKDTGKGTDLIELTFVNMRGKCGPSDIPLTLVVSQRDGLIPYLGNYLYLKENDRFGFEGTLQNYHFAFTPEIKVQRTTLREKFREHYTLQSCVYHLMNMHWMITRWSEDDLPSKYKCTPGELYEDIKAKGYDWNLLLMTRYWHGEVNDTKDHIPYLSTYDLLKMRTGEYHPYWYPVKQKDLKGTPAKIAPIKE